MSNYAIVKSSAGVLESPNKCEVLLKDPTVISELPPSLAPSSTAYTADLSYMAMKDLDGRWKEIGG